MKAMLYLDQVVEPVAVLDDVKIVEFGSDNHPEGHRTRIYYHTSNLNAGKTMVELHRDRKMTVKLEDGRSASALITHASLDASGRFVGVLRVLGPLA
ncbi:MAG: hypothetical protein OXF54_15870 [Caldilineaceae bacterium]|uniref:Uncharacterized protein n=1 Tax=Caldilineaceae bacterium SB0675_bin_29 TaxID=2605266 RepID=A0A6B1FX84_9CHLR|nr:hypothetical protein [Caldilineaceae bacterium]MYH61239.1 hypothetical protein [Caldilineaceae bacterium SB0675_bin_29]